ncbi:aminoacyl--tRNA ligase-related protein [Rhizobium sp. BK377]|uniref:aminoacyl--tRNA ligase-related protein n=1 Tax=Rhizobium sp. BK377 TaxID=2587058 RepID=UPI0016090250|nr:aminoacyl--tRNA ligase-related protein [Rhizobium sp. BK377]MBB3464635.1 glycyl-tRNA synthetase [Rhizobium sp. BK377]
MLNLFNVNSLVHWEEREINMRDHMVRFFSEEVRSFLRSVNPAWDIRRVEAPALTPRPLISDAYTNADIWAQEQLTETEAPLVLRPETTPSTYVYMQHILGNHSRTRLPLCVWQAGRSYRREQEQPIKHMRLKEFWQLEFQCAYTADSGNDYHAVSLEPVRRMIAAIIPFPTRIVPSDRLPAYSQTTEDVEVNNGDKWMEVCSISRRTDFPERYRTQPKKGPAVEQDVLVLEIAIGLDRCVYNWDLATSL